MIVPNQAPASSLYNLIQFVKLTVFQVHFESVSAVREVDPRALVRRAVAVAAPHGGGGPCLGGEARQPRPGAVWGQRAAIRENWLGPGQ